VKKLIVLILIMALTLPGFSAFATLQPTGELTSSEDYGADWFQLQRAEVRTSAILKGNLAFVANSDKAWVEDKQVTLSKKCYMDEFYDIYIPAETAKEYFGVNISEEYIKHSDLKEIAGVDMYYDPLGLVIYSKNGNIPPSVPWNTVCDAMGEIQWEYIDFTPEEREAYIRNWQKLLSIPDEVDREDVSVYISSSMKSAESAREELWYDGIKGPFKDVDIWSQEDRNDSVYLGNLLTCYERIEAMARAYFIEGAKDTLRRDEVLKALEFLYEHHYSQVQETISDAWTVEQLTIPYAYANILCFMYDDMTDEDRVRHTNAVFDRHPDPTVRRGSNLAETYTNRVWRSYSYFNVAMMAGDVERMNYAMKYVNQAYMYTLTGFDNREYDTDGFYEDGSMIFHKGHGYNMGYGQNYMMGNSVQLIATKGTRFDVRNLPGWEIMYELVSTHFLPFIQDNILMRLVKGRNLPGSAQSVVMHICIVMNYAPEPYKTEIAKAVKAAVGDYWSSYENVSNPGDYYSASGATILYEFNKAVEFINSIGEVNTSQKYSNVYYNMDRVIHRMPEFTAGLAMSSRRIYKLEATNENTNGYGWYIGDGMLYMYNGDAKQHNPLYTTESNPYHMPGTTVDSTPRIADWHTSQAIDWGYPDNLWAGATTNGTTTMATYEIGNKYVSSLKGKKSYFMLDDKIVCIGSGITAGNGNVYTTVENFMLSEKGEISAMSDLKLPVAKMTTSVEPGVEYTKHAIFDGDISSAYGSNVYGSWYEYDLGEVKNASGIAIAFTNGTKRQEIFKLEVSEDGENYTTVLDSRGSGTTTKLQYFPAPFKARYVRLVGLANTKSAWFNFSEFNVIADGYAEDHVKEVLATITTGFEDFYVGEEKIETAFNKEFNFNNAEYAWLESAGGYVFGKGSNITFEKETYKDSIQPFAAILLNHGEHPYNASYSYTLLPKKTREETKAYSENPTVEILSETPGLHLAYDKESGIYGASVFYVGKVLDMTVKTPCTLLKDTSKKKIYVSDPTHRFKEIVIELPKGMTVEEEDGIKVNGQQVTINISARKGATYSFSYTEQ